jgi:hypothetical protein
VYTVAEGSGNDDPFLARRAWVLGRGKVDPSFLSFCLMYSSCAHHPFNNNEQTLSLVRFST